MEYMSVAPTTCGFTLQWSVGCNKKVRRIAYEFETSRPFGCCMVGARHQRGCCRVQRLCCCDVVSLRQSEASDWQGRGRAARPFHAAVRGCRTSQDLCRCAR